MTLVYSNRKYRHALFIDRMEEMVQLTLSDMMRQRILDYIPGWWEHLFDNLKSGVMVAYGEVPSTDVLFRQALTNISNAGIYTGTFDRTSYAIVEYWRYAFDGVENPTPNAKMVSCANDDEEEGEFAQCMFIVRKDEGVVGGNLHIHPRMQENYWMYMTGLDNVEPLEMPLELGNTVVMDGNLYHDISPCSGTGEMHIIVVKCKV